MDFFKKRSTTRYVTFLDLLLVVSVLAVCVWKLVEVLVLRVCPVLAKLDANETISIVDIEPMPDSIFVIRISLWVGLFILHSFPLCHAFALIRVLAKGRNEAPLMRATCRKWLNQSSYLLAALFVVFIVLALESDFQSYIGAGVCGVEFIGKLFFRIFIGVFYDSLGGDEEEQKIKLVKKAAKKAAQVAKEKAEKAEAV